MMIGVLFDVVAAIHQNDIVNVAARIRNLFMWFEFKFDLVFSVNLNSHWSVMQINQAKKSVRRVSGNVLINSVLIKL